MHGLSGHFPKESLFMESRPEKLPNTCRAPLVFLFPLLLWASVRCTMNDWLEFDYGMVAGWKGLPSYSLHVGIPGKRSLILDLDLANFNMRRKNTRPQRVYNQINCVSFQAVRRAFTVLFLVAIIYQSRGLFLRADGKIVHINNGTLI